MFLPGESQGQGSLVGCCLWGRTESDTTDATAAAVKDASGPPHSKGGEKVRLSYMHKVNSWWLSLEFAFVSGVDFLPFCLRDL